MSCSEETVTCGNLKSIWAGALWLLCGYVGKKLNLPSVWPINIERLMVEYGRIEAGLVKNLTGEGLYEPIVVEEAKFLPWVVANWEKILMTEVEYNEELVGNRQGSDDDLEVMCYLVGDAETDDDLEMCYLAGNLKRLPEDSDLGDDPFQEVLSNLESAKEERQNPAPEQEGEKFSEDTYMCYRPIDPGRPRPAGRKVERRPAKKPEPGEPKK